MKIIDFTPIETDRLILRRFRESDAEDLWRYRSDPAIATYQLWNPFSREKSRRFIETHARTSQIEPGHWTGIAVELGGTAALIGDCAFKLENRTGFQAEIGFNLATEYQHQGYATEAVRGLADYLFSVIEIHRLFSITDCRNEAAVSLLERIGMRREGHFVKNVWIKGKWGDEYLYALLADEWIKTGVNDG